MQKSIDVKYDLLKTELLLTQQQMDKYDQLSSTTKTWAVTLWVAIVGWTIQTQVRELIFIGIIALIFFWFFDAKNKKFRQDCKNRRNKVALTLETFFETGKMPDSISSPCLPLHENGDLLSNLYIFHIGLPYMTLLVLSVFVYFLV